MSRTDFDRVPIMWEPNENYGKEIRKFRKNIDEKYKIKFDNYWDFHKWSIENLAVFWSAIWDFSEVVYSKIFDKVINTDVPLSSAPHWFEGAELNYAENVLKYRDGRIALITSGEDRETKKVTYAQMYEEVRLYAAAFRKIGVKKGDVVICQMSNREEAVFAAAAVLSIGAIWTGALPLLGAQPVLNRFQQVNPKVFITIDRFPHGGQDINMLPKVKEIANGLPTLEKVVIVASKEESYSKDISDIKNSCFLNEFLKQGREENGSVPPLVFEQVTFQHPVFISYTSGTTGLPKALVHGCGILLGSVKDYVLHTDCSSDSTWFSMSPVGWASWNICLSFHFLGHTVSIFEGVPYFLSPNYFWQLVEEHKITHMLLPSATLEELQKRNYVPTEENLKSLRVMMAGGSVVKPEVYDFMYENGAKNIPFASTFGCTEFLGSSMIIDTTLPIYKGEIPTVALASDIYTVNDKGERVIGEIGELVLAKPMPNLPLGIWNDKDGSIFREKYFSNYPEKFSMGDYAIINPVTNGIIICCRSDETLKQRGCRFGSSEIYSVVDSFQEVRDSICVSKYSKKMDESAVLFLKMADGHEFNEELVGRIRKGIAQALTADHVPDIILETKDIPYNINSKKMETTVKKIINNMPYNADSIRNPECLKAFYDIPELQSV